MGGLGECQNLFNAQLQVFALQVAQGILHSPAASINTVTQGALWRTNQIGELDRLIVCGLGQGFAPTRCAEITYRIR
jgi:hypothetical protein